MVERPVDERVGVRVASPRHRADRPAIELAERLPAFRADREAAFLTLILPVLLLFLVLQRYYMQGLLAGSVKG